MTRPIFLADHDCNAHIIPGVQRRESAIECSRVRDGGLSTQPDAEILAYADRYGLIVVSHDVHTMPAAAYAKAHCCGSSYAASRKSLQEWDTSWTKYWPKRMPAWRMAPRERSLSADGT